MSSFRLRRLASVVSAALLGVMLLGAGSASASTPGWQFSPAIDTTLNPPTVGTGFNAAFIVNINNLGSSNISALYLSTDIPLTAANVTPTFIGNATWYNALNQVIAGPTRPCGNAPYSGPLNCSFGNLAAGNRVKLTIAFAAAAPGTNYGTNDATACVKVSDATKWTFHFTAFGNGNTPTDKGHTSHGDTLCGLASLKTSSDPNFAGGFTLDTSSFGTTGTLGNGNKQKTTLYPPAGFIAATVEDGLSDTAFSCTIVACANRFGEWSRLSVNGGSPYDGGFKVQLLVLGSSVPGPAKTTNINVIHNDGTTTYVISQRCDATTLPTVSGGAECIIVTMVGKNFLITAWLNHNGGLRGTY